MAKPIIEINAQVQTWVDDMLETMYAAPGIGLAATQVNIHKQLIVIDISEQKNSPLVVINPQIEKVIDAEPQPYDEGCLSVPGFYEQVTRPNKILLTAKDRTGETYQMLCEGLLATCVQHEMDHLNGKLFVDYLSKLKRNSIRNKLNKEQKENSKA